MALKDGSGRITIDEYAAQQDIQKINQAKVALENSKKAIENIINQAGSEQGQTANAIVEKAIELKTQINTMIGRLNETSSFISNTIAHYQEVDRLIKEAIQNSAKTVASTAKPVETASQRVTASTPTPKPTTSAPKISSKNVVEDVVDAISDAFKKWF